MDTWGPFVFVNPDRDAAALADTLGDLPALVAESGVDLDAPRVPLAPRVGDPQSNWKVAIENFLECYHCPVAHPGFSKVIDVDPDAYLLTVSAAYSSQVGRIRASVLAGNGKSAYVPRGEVTQAQYHFVWPNTTINIEVGPANVAIERWVPSGLRTTVEVTDYFFAEDVPEAQAQEVIEFGTQVGTEDLALLRIGSGGPRHPNGPSGEAHAAERAADPRLPAEGRRGADPIAGKTAISYAGFRSRENPRSGRDARVSQAGRRAALAGVSPTGNG